jgi:hypothetical protein
MTVGFLSKSDPKTEKAQEAIDHARKLLRDNPKLNKDARFLQLLKELEAARNAYIRERPELGGSPTAVATSQAGTNPLAYLIAALIALLAGKAMQAATTNITRQRQTEVDLDEAARRLLDYAAKLKEALAMGGATVILAKLMDELADKLKLPRDRMNWDDFTRNMIRLAILKQLAKYPDKCRDLANDYNGKLTRLGAGNLSGSNWETAWLNFLKAAVLLVRCLLKGPGGGPPGTPAPA